MTPAVLRRGLLAFALPLSAAVYGALLLPSASAAPKAPPASNAPGVHLLRDSPTEAVTTACPQGWVCVYDGREYTWGAFAVLPGTEVTDTARLTLTNGVTMKDRISSWVNNSPVTYCWYEKTGYRGTEHRMDPAGKTGSITPDDKLTSFKPC